MDSLTGAGKSDSEAEYMVFVSDQSVLCAELCDCDRRLPTPKSVSSVVVGNPLGHVV